MVWEGRSREALPYPDLDEIKATAADMLEGVKVKASGAL